MEYICLCGKNFGNAKKAFRAHNKACQDKPKSFNCQFCGKEISKKGALAYHELRCDLNPNRETNVKKMSNNGGGTSGKELPSKEGGWNCSCGKNFRTRRLLTAHKKTCKFNYVETNGSIRRVVHIKYVDYTCQFCKEVFVHKPMNTKTLHEKQCWSNPNRVPNARTGTHNSEESKKKTSETMKRKITEGSIIVPYKRNHSSKVSYPEKYFMEVFKDLPVKYNYQVGLYQLDFAIPEKMVYIEIDGEQHFCDKRIVEHDKERTQKLESLGWNCLKRVRWSDYKKLNQEQQKQYCNELIQLLSK